MRCVGVVGSGRRGWCGCGCLGLGAGCGRVVRAVQSGVMVVPLATSMVTVLQVVRVGRWCWRFPVWVVWSVGVWQVWCGADGGVLGDGGHRTCFLQDPSTSDLSDLYYLHPYTKSIHQFKERNKLHFQQDGQEWTRNQGEFDEGKVESLNCKKWKSVCYRVVDKWRDILVDYFERNHNFRPQVDAFANKKNKRFPKFYDDAWSEDWSEPLWINLPFDVFPRVVQKLKQSGAKAILIVPNWPRQEWFKDIMDISIDIVELPHKGVKLYCEDNGKPLPQRSWSTLACLVDGNLGNYWQDDSEMGTEEVISNSSRIDKIEVDEDDREQNPDVSSRKEGRTIGVPQDPRTLS